MRSLRAFIVRLLTYLLGCLALGISAQSSGAPGPTNYTVIDLGPYGPAAINNQHQIAVREQLLTTTTPGGEMLSSHPFAALWQSGNVRPLAENEEYAAAAGLNNDGDVVGYGPASPCTGCPATAEARLWHPDGTTESLPSLSESATQATDSGSEAHAINDKGEIVGWAFRYVNRGLWQRAVRWRDERGEPLGQDAAGASAAFAINDLGDAVGWAELASTSDLRAPQRAALWSAEAPSTTTDLGALGSSSARSVAHGINNAREVVGASDTATGSRRAFLWTRGAMSDLGTLSGDTDSEAPAINARGEVVGISFQQQCGHAGLEPCDGSRAARWTSPRKSRPIRAGTCWRPPI